MNKIKINIAYVQHLSLVAFIAVGILLVRYWLPDADLALKK